MVDSDCALSMLARPASAALARSQAVWRQRPSKRGAVRRSSCREARMNAKGIWAVIPVLVSLWCPVGTAQETLLNDAFDRANSATVGNGWVETEATGAAAGISNGQLVFTDTSDVVRRPMVVHALPQTTSGLVVWEFQLNWSRTGNESAYAVHMQLGDGTRMSADSVDAGVAVNLV